MGNKEQRSMFSKLSHSSVCISLSSPSDTHNPTHTAAYPISVSVFFGLTFTTCAFAAAVLLVPLRQTKSINSPTVTEIDCNYFASISLDISSNLILQRGFYFIGKNLYLYNKQRDVIGCYEVKVQRSEFFLGGYNSDSMLCHISLPLLLQKTSSGEKNGKSDAPYAHRDSEF